MERWTQEWLGATEGRETSLRTSPLSSPPQYALMETEEKTHSIHSIGDVKFVRVGQSSTIYSNCVEPQLTISYSMWCM